MEQMPEYKEGYITLWRNGTWVQVHLDEMPKIMEEDNRGAEESSNVSSGA